MINAPRQKVWDAITTDALYREWTMAFCEGSYFEGGWNKGDAIRFYGPDKDGNVGGMISEIAESRMPEYISIRHVGMIENGVEDRESEKVKAWLPAFENYTLKEVDGGTEFSVDMDSSDEYYAAFAEMWPRALAKLKEISERN